MLSGRVPGHYEPNELTRLLEERRAAGLPVLDLTVTNPTRTGLTRPGAEVARRLAEGARGPYEPDPRGLPAAREAIAAYYEERRVAAPRPAAPGGRLLDPRRLVLTAGTSEGYAHLFRLLCDPGDEIAAPRPSYPLFEPLARLEGIALSPYRLAYEGRWRLDIASLEAAVGPRTRAVLIVAPNNPTGSCLDAAELRAVESLCEARGIAMIADEVFGDFPWPPRREPLPSLLGHRRVPTFVLGGLSKACGLPHVKLAWIAVSGPDAAADRALEGLEWISDLFLSVGAPAQEAAGAALESRREFQERVRDRIRGNLTALGSICGSTGAAEVLAGDGGWSAVLRARAPGAAISAARALESGVLIHPGHFYDLDDSCFVVSLLTEPSTLAEGLGRVLALA